VSLRTRREDVDKETAGHDGILNDLVGLTGELHILYTVCPVCVRVKREVRLLELASELGDVILIPYVFSMMFLPSAL